MNDHHNIRWRWFHRLLTLIIDSQVNNIESDSSCKQPIEPPPPIVVAIIQEYFIDPLGSYVVFSPFNIPDLNISINGYDSLTLSLLSSRFVISHYRLSISKDQNISNSTNINGSSNNSTSFLLTVAFQQLMPGPEGVNSDGVDVDVNSL